MGLVAEATGLFSFFCNTDKKGDIVIVDKEPCEFGNEIIDSLIIRIGIDETIDYILELIESLQAFVDTNVLD